MQNNKLLNFQASETTNIALLWKKEDFQNIENPNKESQEVEKSNETGDECKIFHPIFTHQIFKDEIIIGYDPLRLNIYFGAGTLYSYIDTNYTLKSRNITNVEKEYIKLFSKQDPPTANSNEFSLILDDKEDRFKPPGTMVNEYTITDKQTQQERHFEVYFGRITDSYVQRYHERCQIFALWYIDGSSYIFTDDSNWDLFFLFERKLIDGQKRYGFAGYCTVYNFYHHPSLNRSRISQFLLLPIYQRQGHGKNLLNSIYNYYKSNDSVYGKVYDMTVEDPCDEFTQLRNYVDLCNILDGGFFKGVSLDLTADNKDLLEEIRKKLLITNIQAKTCLEIYLYSKFMNTPSSDPRFKNYRIQVKKKLYKQFIGDSEMGEIVEKQTINPENITPTDQKTIEQNKIKTIIELYKTVEEDYTQTIQSIGIKIQNH
ncbi:putative histone acetyltransferase [Tieghemostelium lacteum]|uniref:histone acetyltransferase n=1 Tax=Tieghemostelium lacteum TaxID=361077 RepID=A0A151Z962_TIELA|nr:putative histone acetyltransferase [Tieghemostelium lacteum]|eukprot:KYQ90488.1 putative histone acetyltransferase [Tieghemostelium lacteum]